MHPSKLLNIIARAIVAIGTQETITDASRTVYEELVTLDNDLRMCLHTSPEVLFSEHIPLPSEQEL